MRSNGIIITGISGFIGTHFLQYFLKKTNYRIVGIDSFRHKGMYSRLNELHSIWDAQRIKIFQHDLTSPIDSILSYKIQEFCVPNAIINLASNSAVERSVINPVECWNNNTQIILNMLEWLRQGQGMNIYHCPFYHISTDEVYGDYDGSGTGHQEWSPIVPSNPYSASKAAQEDLCIAYWRTYGLPIVICNTMNNIGEWQDPEKFLPRIIRCLLRDETVPVYTDENNKAGSRVYLDAQNHAQAILFLMQQPTPMYQPRLYPEVTLPSRYNICGTIELDNLDLALKVADLMGIKLKYELKKSESVRPGYDKRYLLDGSKLAALGFKPQYNFESTLERIIDFYTLHPEWATS
jgi:dTDP-glucose 4,6-dehydratase